MPIYQMQCENGHVHDKYMRISEMEAGGHLCTECQSAARVQIVSTMITRDTKSFISPIDGKEVRGKNGMRDHCERHGVVPFSDVFTEKSTTVRPTVDTKALKQTIADIVNTSN